MKKKIKKSKCCNAEIGTRTVVAGDNKDLWKNTILSSGSYCSKCNNPNPWLNKYD